MFLERGEVLQFILLARIGKHVDNYLKKYNLNEKVLRTSSMTSIFYKEKKMHNISHTILSKSYG